MKHLKLQKIHQPSKKYSYSLYFGSWHETFSICENENKETGKLTCDLNNNTNMLFILENLQKL